MAVITQDQVSMVYTEAGARVRTLLMVRDVSGGDTIDLAALGFFRVVKQAAWMAVTVLGIASSAIAQPATVAAPAQMQREGAYLLVDGVPV